MSMRLFVAVPLQKSAAGEIVELQKELSKSLAKMRLVEGKNLHISLLFFRDGDLDSIVSAMNMVKEKSFGLVFDRVGMFNSRVVWVGGHGKRLINIHRVMSKELGVAQRFKCHVTLARLRSRPDVVVQSLVKKDVEIKTHVDRIVLFKSTLTPKGPIYEKMHEVALM